jgi:lipoprotein-releasing system permease protein
MNLPLALWIGLRYTRAKSRLHRRNHFISFISGVSMLGIALGVMALIVVLSVMNGFQSELKDRILGVAAHVEVGAFDGRVTDWQALLPQLKTQREVMGAAPFVAGQALLSEAGVTRGVMLRGIDPTLEGEVNRIGSQMRSGHLEDLRPGEFGILLGLELAQALNVHRGDHVTLIVPEGTVTPAGVLPRMRQFTVAGIFAAGMYEYDAGLAFLHLQDAQRLFRMDAAISGIRLRLTDMDRAPWVSRQIEADTGGIYQVSDWTRQHENFFRAVQIEKRMMFIILTLIVAVATFNIVSTLVMAVQDKQADIAILRTLGLKPASVMQVFMVQGCLIGVIGTLSGMVAGVLISLNIETVVPFMERLLGMDLFPADVYYISELPSKLAWGDVVWVGGVALGLAFLATLYPSWRASRVMPAEALRYE